MGRDIGRPYLTLTPRDGGLGGGESIIITWWIKAREISETAASRLWEPTPISRTVAHALHQARSWHTTLPLYALPLILPYRSYIGTLAHGVWIGNSPEISEFSKAVISTREDGVPPEVFRFPTQTRARAGPGGADTGNSRREKIDTGWRHPTPGRSCPPKAPAP